MLRAMRWLPMKVPIENCGQDVVRGRRTPRAGDAGQKPHSNREPGSGRGPAREEIWGNQETETSTATHGFHRTALSAFVTILRSKLTL